MKSHVFTWRLRIDGITVFAASKTRHEAKPFLLRSYNGVAERLGRPPLAEIAKGTPIERVRLDGERKR